MVIFQLISRQNYEKRFLLCIKVNSNQIEWYANKRIKYNFYKFYSKVRYLILAIKKFKFFRKCGFKKIFRIRYVQFELKNSYENWKLYR